MRHPTRALRRAPRRAPRAAALLIALLAALPAAAAPRAACDVKGARIEEAIAARPALRADADAQAVRDLRTLRDAAIVLDAYKYPGECEVLLGIARTLLADPDRAIGQGDNDEDKAEAAAEAREPKAEPKVEPKADPKAEHGAPRGGATEPGAGGKAP